MPRRVGELEITSAALPGSVRLVLDRSIASRSEMSSA